MAGRVGRPDPDLFTPTVGNGVAYDPLPWRPDSNFYVAFFGGIVPATVIAFLNARRLHARDVSWRILAIGVVAAALFLGGAYNLDQQVVDTDDAHRYARLGVRIAGVVVHFVFLALLRSPWRRFQVARAGDPAPMWGPGIGAAIGGGFLQAALLLGIMGEL